MRIALNLLAFVATLTGVCTAQEAPSCALICLDKTVARESSTNPAFDPTNQESLCDIPLAMNMINACLRSLCSRAEETVSRELVYGICGEQGPLDATVTTTTPLQTVAPSSSRPALVPTSIITSLPTPSAYPSSFPLPDPGKLFSFVNSVFEANGMTEFAGILQPTSTPISAGSRLDVSNIGAMICGVVTLVILL